jgi:hypothetical protein
VTNVVFGVVGRERCLLGSRKGGALLIVIPLEKLLSFLFPQKNAYFFLVFIDGVLADLLLVVVVVLLNALSLINLYHRLEGRFVLSTQNLFPFDVGQPWVLFDLFDSVAA